MPQEFQVLRCYQCSTFQVHQVKKAKKWSCKMCGEKQSVIKVFGRGVAADCRHHVQKLNSLRGEIEQVTIVTPTEPSICGEQSEVSHTSQTQICEDSIPSVDRWSRFVTSKQEEEDVAEDEQYDDCFTTDMAEFRQKQMTRKRKRNQKHDDYEDESSEQSQFNYHRNQSHARRRPSRIDTSPEGSYINVGQRGDADHSEINPNIQLQGNRSHLHGNYQSGSCNSTQYYNRGQRHMSSLDGYENDVDQYSCYNEDQKDELFECASGRSAGTGRSNYQDIKNVHILNTGQGHHEVMTEGQSLNRGQGHHHVLNDVPGLIKGQDDHQVLTKGQSVKRGKGHHGGVKKIQSVSKWSKYQDESDSGEETCSLTEQPEMTNLSEKYQNVWNMDKKISAGDVICVQNREERNRENTGTVLDSSVEVGNPKGLLNNTGSLTEKVTNPDGMWKQSQHRMWTGGEFREESIILGIEGSDRRLKGDNSNSLIGLEEKPGNTDVQGEDGIINGGYSKFVRNHKPEDHSEGTFKSHVTEHKSSVSTVARCNQKRSNVSNSKQGIGYSGHVSRPLTQKSTLLQPMFVTEDITDEDLVL